MKTSKIILFSAAVILSSQASAQFFGGSGVKQLTDRSIVAQEKRQVFQQWGDWRPKPNYNFFGVQTNVAYMMVWGWLAPSRNKSYKKGADIRPLGPTGLQNQRYVSTLVQQETSEQTIQQVDSIYKQATDEFLHYTKLTVPVDPLYLLYYKKMLEDLDEFNPDSNYYKDWNLANPEVYQNCLKYGLLNEIKRKIETLQEKYDMARTIDIARGKRILMYHECLLEWRKCKNYLSFLNSKEIIRIDAVKKLDKIKNSKTDPRKKTDAEIYTDILMKVGI
jgi:hypothetical protein